MGRGELVVVGMDLRNANLAEKPKDGEHFVPHCLLFVPRSAKKRWCLAPEKRKRGKEWV
jgi:hypothetical protein